MGRRSTAAALACAAIACTMHACGDLVAVTPGSTDGGATEGGTEGGVAPPPVAPPSGNGCVDLADLGQHATSSSGVLSVSGGAISLSFPATSGPAMPVDAQARGSVPVPTGNVRTIITIVAQLAKRGGSFMPDGYVTVATISNGNDPGSSPTIDIALGMNDEFEIDVFSMGENVSGQPKNFSLPMQPIPFGMPVKLTLDATWAKGSGAVSLTTGNQAPITASSVDLGAPLGGTLVVQLGGQADDGSPAVDIQYTSLCVQFSR